MAEKTHCDACNRNFPSPDALAMHNKDTHTISSEPKKSSKKLIYTIVIISIILIIGLFIIFNSFGKTTNSNAINQADPSNQNTLSTPSQKVQKITLGMNGNYNPNTITVKSGIPVEITLDSSVGGCYRNFNIPDLGVSQSSSSPSDTIKFTPNQKGTFRFRCSMGMGTGTIIVE